MSGGWRALAITFGILASLAAVGALVWPAPTLLIVSIFVAWYLLFSGIFEVTVALSNTDVRGWWIRLLGGIASFALGAWAIGNPDRSVLLLVTVIGVFAIFRGTADLVTGFQLREVRDEVGGRGDGRDRRSSGRIGLLHPSASHRAPRCPRP